MTNTTSLTEAERLFARWVRDERDVCRLSLGGGERAMATSLCRRRVLVSDRVDGCRAPHYRASFLVDVR